MGQQIQDLPLQGHRGAGGVLLQSLDHQRLKQTDVVVNGILKGKKVFFRDNSLLSTEPQGKEKRIVLFLQHNNTCYNFNHENLIIPF